MIIHKQNIGTGPTLSPLDLIKTAVDASSDWSTKATDSAEGYLDKLWIEATNTTTGDQMALMFTFIRDSGVTVKACEYIDLGQPDTNQPNQCDEYSFFTDNYIKCRGGHRGLTQDIVIIHRDYIYVNWAGQANNIKVTYNIYEDSTYPAFPFCKGCFFGVIERTHNYNKGTVFLTSNLQKTFYDDLWYGESVLTDINQRQGRINALYPPELYEGMGLADAYFYTPISIHVNIDNVTDDAKMILLGYLAGNIFGTVNANKATFGTDVTLPEGQHISYNAYSIEGVDSILFPLA